MPVSCAFLNHLSFSFAASVTKLKLSSNLVCACLLQAPATYAKINELVHEVDQLQRQDAAFEETCRRAQFDHELEVYQLKQGHGNEVKALELEHEDKVERLKRQHAKQVAEQHDVRLCAMGAYDEEADAEDKLRQLQQKLWEATRNEACLSATCAELVSQAVVHV